jgi:chemotaxis-related protein WspB
VLLVLFQMGGERYALGSRHVVEIVPLVRFRELPHAPEYVCGLFEYRGLVTPVVDLSSLAGKGASQRLLSTRIILVHYLDSRDRMCVLGLLAERVTDTIEVEESKLKPPGIRIEDAPYLRRVVTDSTGMIQCIELEELLPTPVRDILFPADEG